MKFWKDKKLVDSVESRLRGDPPPQELSPVTKALLKGAGPLLWIGVFSIPVGYFVRAFWITGPTTFVGGLLLIGFAQRIENTIRGR